MLFKSDYSCQSQECSPDINCLKCGLYKKVKHPKMNYTGKGAKKCLIIAEAPGEDEDRMGIQLVGDTGKWFRRKLAAFNLSLDQDFWKINAVNCRPADGEGRNRKPTPEEIKYCRNRIICTIKELQPTHIWLMGGTAIESFYQDHFNTDMLSIGKWRRWCIPDHHYNAHIIPLWHPSYIMRNEKDANLQSTYVHDLAFAVDCFRKPAIKNPTPNLNYSTDFEEICQWLRDLLQHKPPFLYFDYETNCLKPQLKGSKIASVGYAVGCRAYSFPYQYPNILSEKEQKIIQGLWAEVLASKKISKGAHHLQFETGWSCKHFAEPANWAWDTQLAAHILDNRRAVSGLKFQAYVNFGQYPYNTEVSSLLEPAGKNKFNSVFEIPIEKLLKYNAMDCFWGFQLRLKQSKLFREDSAAGGKLFEGAYKGLFLPGADALSDMERSGLRVNVEYFKKTQEKLVNDLEETKKKIWVDPSAVRFKKKFGHPLRIKKNVSTEDLRNLITEVLHEKIEKVTATELESTDAEVLQRLEKHSIIKNILELRKLEKLNNTYIKGYIQWSIDGYVYPNIGLQGPTSYRSSAANPNIQNVVKRYLIAKEMIRRGIIPRPGRQLGELDFSGIEVATGCFYHKDPKMMHYLTVGGDMHHDAAKDLWMLPDSEIVKKTIRFYAKNQWVFPQFYGSTWRNCSKNLWETCIDLTTTSGETLRNHMRRKKINTFHEFEEHLQDCERILWNRFRVYKQWKENINKEFREKGFLESFFGFKYTDFMGFNECTNYVVQGTAFHLLLWTYIQVNKRRREEGWRTKIPAEIHDSMLFDFHPKEVPHIIKTVKHIAEVETMAKFKWINVPIKIEAEVAPVGSSWNDLVEYKEAA